MTQLILGFGNKARHGKDTAAAAIAEYYGLYRSYKYKHNQMEIREVKVQKTAFADALYREANEWLATETGKMWVQEGHNGWEYYNPGWCEGSPQEEIIKLPEWVTPSNPPLVDPRSPLGKHSKLLQWWGTEYRRAQDHNYWIKRGVESIDPKADVVIFTDVRFENEAKAIKDLGGYVVNFTRLDASGKLFIDPSRDPNHPSEIELDDYPWDFKFMVGDGHPVLAGEIAITLAQYLRALQDK